MEGRGAYVRSKHVATCNIYSAHIVLFELSFPYSPRILQQVFQHSIIVSRSNQTEFAICTLIARLSVFVRSLNDYVEPATTSHLPVAATDQ